MEVKYFSIKNRANRGTCRFSFNREGATSINSKKSISKTTKKVNKKLDVEFSKNLYSGHGKPKNCRRNVTEY